MAMLTLRPIGAVMDVILVITACTGAGQCHLATDRRLVALGTGDVLVLAFQLEAGLVMIEIPALPVARVMTVLAPRPQAPLVHVMLFMA